MTHRIKSNVLDRILELFAQHGFDGMAKVLQLILKQAMLVDRSQILSAEPYALRALSGGEIRAPQWKNGH